MVSTTGMGVNKLFRFFHLFPHLLNGANIHLNLGSTTVDEVYVHEVEYTVPGTLIQCLNY